MLKSFRVRNFKVFEDELHFDLSKTSNYAFNSSAIVSGVAVKTMVYGQNGCGKSNLGLAIFDIILHLTDREKLFNKYMNYLNMNSESKTAHFEYEFAFQDGDVRYIYDKADMQNLKYEKLIINGETVIEYDYEINRGFSLLDGTQNLKMEFPDGRLSKLKYIKSNAILTDTAINRAFNELMDFVDNMLMFYCLEGRGYQGLMLGGDNIDDFIVKSGKLKDFENLLHKAGVNEELQAVMVNGLNQIQFVYRNGGLSIHEAASTGTLALELFYYWYIKMSQASFVFIDEFDAFYHHELAELIVRELIELENTQVIITTHNTDLISNDLLRPDCYYKLANNSIKSISNLTQKELRRAHNLQKMYKAGAFNE